jgi:hypothetical protein
VGSNATPLRILINSGLDSGLDEMIGQTRMIEVSRRDNPGDGRAVGVEGKRATVLRRIARPPREGS